MDLSTLAAPIIGAPDEAVSAASASLRSASSAVRQFARATWGFESDLRRESAFLRQARGNTSGGKAIASDPLGLKDITSMTRTIGSISSLLTSSKGLGGLFGLAGQAGGVGSLLGTIGSFSSILSGGLGVVSLVSSLFGGKKPSVGPGGEFNFILDPKTGKAQATSTAQDNGYDATSVNQSSADAIGSAALAFFKKVGGTYLGVDDPAYSAGHLGYNAGNKKYYGGRSAGFARAFDSPDQAAEAALIDVIKYAKVDGLSKDIQDRLKTVSSTKDLEDLLGYIDQLRSVYDGFKNWTEPLTESEAAMKALSESFAEAKGAAGSLMLSVDALEASYARQRDYLVRQFVDPLETRYQRAIGNDQAADLRSFDAQAAITRRDAAALGGQAVLQAERTLGAERANIVRRYQTQILDAATAQAMAAVSILEKTYKNLATELERAQSQQLDGLTRSRDLWREVVDGLQDAREGLLVGRLSPLDPQARMLEAQRQFDSALKRANGGDATAALQVQSLAEQALMQTQSYFASAESYASYFQQVQDQLAALQSVSAARAADADQQIAALRGTETNTRAIADITRDMAAVLSQIATARTNVITQAAGGGATGSATSSAITQAYQTALGRAPEIGGGTYWANQIATGAMTVEQATSQIKNSNEAKIFAVYQELLGRAPDEFGQQFWGSVLTNKADIEQVRAGIMSSAEYQSLKKFASGGDHLGGWRIVGERGPELEATGPARIWNFDQTQKLLSNDNSVLAGAIAALGSKLDALIQVSASSGDQNTQGLALLREEMAELRRLARLSEAA